MDVKIEIDKKDIGFQYKSVKSLLEKFAVIEENKASVKSLAVSLDFKESDMHELSNALIWRLMRRYQDLHCENKTIRYSQQIKPELEKRHFLDRLTGRKPDSAIDKNIPFHFESFEPYRDLNDAVDGISAESVYSKAMEDILDPENLFHSEVGVNISEILNNVFDHSEYSREAGIVCTKSDKNILTFCSVDMGQGFKSSFVSNPGLKNIFKNLSDGQAIQKATRFRESCNPQNNRHPSYKKTTNAGIGLYFLKNFAKMHRDGQLVIISNKGYYYIDNTGKEIIRDLHSVEWPGALVYFKVSLDENLKPAYQELAMHI
jgi:hypothetical protein